MGLDLAAVKQAIDDLGTSHKKYRDTNDDRLKALEAGNEARAKELDQRLAKFDADITAAAAIKREIETEMKVERERIDDLERHGTKERKQIEVMRDQHCELFVKALRGQFDDPDSKHELKQHEAKMMEAKAITVGTASAGGYAVPEELSRDIEKLERLFSPVRDLVKVVPTGRSDYKELISIGGTTSGWVGESGTRSETETSALREKAPTHGELYAYPQASEWSLDDMFFDVAGWLTEEVSEEFAIQESTAILSGNGTNKPTGMLNTTPTTATDSASPLRDEDAYQYIASAASPDAILPDTLLDLVYAVNTRYRSNASFAMNSLTTGAVRKLKDANDQYLWAPGLAVGEPDRLLGYAHVTWEQMDDVGANNFPVGFGNWRRAYLLNEITGMRMTVDQVTNPGFVRFFIRRREGGIVLNNNAVKFLRTT